MSEYCLTDLGWELFNPHPTGLRVHSCPGTPKTSWAHGVKGDFALKHKSLCWICDKCGKVGFVSGTGEFLVVERKTVKYRNEIQGVDVETEVTPKEVVGAHEVARALIDDAFVRGWAEGKGYTEDLENFRIPPTLVSDVLKIPQAAMNFAMDNFAARRASQSGAGVAYDPESLLTGEEIAQGLDYDCPRVWRFARHREAAIRGEIAVGDIPRLAPRVRKEEIHG